MVGTRSIFKEGIYERSIMCDFCMRGEAISLKNAHYYLGKIEIDYCPKCGRHLSRHGFDFSEDEAIRVTVRSYSMNDEIRISNRTTIEEIVSKYGIEGRITLDGIVVKPEDYKKMICDFTSEKSCYIQQVYKLVPSNGVINVVLC